MNRIYTRNYVFEEFNNNNIDHISLLKDLDKDELTFTFFKDYKNIINSIDNKTYYSYIIKQNNNYIRLVTLTQNNEFEFVFSHIINPKYRGLKHSSKIKMEFLKYLFENDIANIVICYIDKNNQRSISSMMRTNPDNIEIANGMYKVTYNNKKKNMSNKL